MGANFTGAPITLDLKAVEVVELLRIFADLSNMNIIVDPGIRGRVTVKMRDVPWDQAFVTILKNQGLGFTVEGNIIRIATLRKLNAEIRAQRQLSEAQLVSEPLSTEIVYLNYAAPTQIRKLLTPQLSRRGQILTDNRTNSLIVKDVQGNINRVKRLVEILDVRTKQISVDAQIVTTTKAFTRDLGITWGGNLIASPQTGNDTGLPFPNDISTNFGVNLPAGSLGFIGFNFGNVLDTVNLNALLGAAEAEGNSKTISNPRVTTSDNVSASVRAGSIVPYSTVSVSGSTLIGTVVFREAAISLSVTPHVTSDNYVRMKVNISADAPDFSAATSAGPVIQTNSLTTTVLVKDGDTFVIGGLNSSIEGSNQQRVPFLHRLPVIGRLLFKNQRMSNSYDDLLMFITPRIVQDEAVRQRSLVFESYELKGSDKERPAPAPSNP
jgi:type IV pilus assembly protein PilQ